MAFLAPLAPIAGTLEAVEVFAVETEELFVVGEAALATSEEGGGAAGDLAFAFGGDANSDTSVGSVIHTVQDDAASDLYADSTVGRDGEITEPGAQTGFDVMEPWPYRVKDVPFDRGWGYRPTAKDPLPMYHYVPSASEDEAAWTIVTSDPENDVAYPERVAETEGEKRGNGWLWVFGNANSKDSSEISSLALDSNSSPDAETGLALDSHGPSDAETGLALDSNVESKASSESSGLDLDSHSLSDVESYVPSLEEELLNGPKFPKGLKAKLQVWFNEPHEAMAMWRTYNANNKYEVNHWLGGMAFLAVAAGPIAYGIYKVTPDAKDIEEAQKEAAAKVEAYEAIQRAKKQAQAGRALKEEAGIIRERDTPSAPPPLLDRIWPASAMPALEVLFQGRLDADIKHELHLNGFDQGGTIAVAASIMPMIPGGRRRRGLAMNQHRHPAIMMLNDTRLDADKADQLRAISVMQPIYKDVPHGNLRMHGTRNGTQFNEHGIATGCLEFDFPGVEDNINGCYLMIDETVADKDRLFGFDIVRNTIFWRNERRHRELRGLPEGGM